MTDNEKDKVTSDAVKVADGFENFSSRLGLNQYNGNTLSQGFYDFNLVTNNRTQLEAAYRGSWIVGQMIDTVANDMVRAGVNISTSEGESDIKDLLSAMSRLKIWQSLGDGVRWGRLYGGAIGVVQIKGQSLSSPIDLDTIDKDQFQGIAIYDRWQLNPVLMEVIDAGPDMGLPKYYQIVNNLNSVQPSDPTPTGELTVHHSRIIRFIGDPLPFFQAITNMMWGESVLERMWDRLISFDTVTMSTANLVDRANLRTVSIDGLRQIVSAGGPAQAGLEAQFEMMRRFQTNEGITLLDKEDAFQSTAYSFAGLDAVLLQFGQQLSGSSQIPLVKLFGQSPAGLSATGESDLRMYYDNINAQQEGKLRNGVELILKVLWRSTYGRPAPKDMEFTFAPLWQTSAMDKAVIAKSNAETIIGAYEAGLTDKSTSMKELRQSSGDTGLFNNITDEDIAEAEEDDENPPMPLELEGDPNAAPAPKQEEPKEPVKNLDSAYTKIKRWLNKK